MKARSRKKTEGRYQRPALVVEQTCAAPLANPPETGRPDVTVTKAWPAAPAMGRANSTPGVSEGQSRSPAGPGPRPDTSSDVIVDLDEDGGSMVFWFLGRSK